MLYLRLLVASIGFVAEESFSRRSSFKLSFARRERNALSVAIPCRGGQLVDPHGEPPRANSMGRNHMLVGKALRRSYKAST
eukprot:6194008-Pleurochrysis_carterae.AAC.1